MMKTLTKNDDLKFLYGEASESEQVEIHRELILNEELQEQFIEFNSLKSQIDKVIIEAPQRAVDKILKFVRQSDLESA